MALPFVSVVSIATRLSLGVAILAPLSALGEEAATTSSQTQTQQTPAPPLLTLTPAPAPAPSPLLSPAPSPIPLLSPAPTSTPVPTFPYLDMLDVFDAPRDYLAEKFVGLVTDIDSFFGNDRNYQETNNSVVQLDLVRVTGYGGQNKIVLQGRANVQLPQAEKRLHLLLESDPDKNTASGPTQAQAILPGTNTTPASYGAGLRYEKSQEERWHFSTDGGLKFHGINTTPFARMRGSYAIPLEQWRLKAAETAFWFNTTGAGETTQVDLERPFSDPLLFRASSIATWLNNTQNFDLRQDFLVFQTVNERTAMQYQASVVGVSSPTAQVTDYFILLLYRHRLHREWTYLEISPQLHFPRDKNFQASPALSIRLEILFDKSR